MKYDKLKQMCKKSRRCRVIVYCCIIPVVILFALLVGLKLGAEHVINDVILGCTFTVSFIVIVVSIIASRIEGKWNRRIEDYIALRVMKVINEFGIDSSNFELIQETCVSYKVAFHNQIIDYEALQSRLDKEVNAMNKITGDNIRVYLI